MKEIHYEFALGIYAGYADSGLIEMHANLKNRYQDARNRDDHQEMRYCEQHLRAIDELLCREVKLCVKCKAPISHAQLVADERCQACED